jgi:hypothetical protein
MRFWPAIVAAALICGSTGCLHNALERHTARAATTPMDIQYRIVLNNMARFTINPATLPGQSRIQDGTVQVGDDVGTGYYSGFTFTRADGFGISQLGPVAHRTVTMEWGTDAVMNPIEVHDLRNLYRQALCLPPLPDPGHIARAREEKAREADRDRGKEDDDNGDPFHAATQHAGDHHGEARHGAEREDPSDPGSLNDNGSSNNNGANNNGDGRENPNCGNAEPGARNGDFAKILLSEQPYDLALNSSEGVELLPVPEDRQQRARPAKTTRGAQTVPAPSYDVPIGWFFIGSKKDVPKNACYVGCSNDRYVWVMDEGVDGLAEFTLAVLSITQLDPAERGFRRGITARPGRAR